MSWYLLAVVARMRGWWADKIPSTPKGYVVHSCIGQDAARRASARGWRPWVIRRRVWILIKSRS